MRSIAPIALSAAILLGPQSVWAQQTGQRYGQHMWDGGWHGWFVGPIMMIAFLVIAVVAVVLIVRWIGGSGQSSSTYHASPPHQSALDVLRERYARGEIDKDEYEERRRTLGD